MKYVIFLMLCVFSGCAFAPREAGRVPQNAGGRIIRAEAFVQGGDVQIVPFTPGVHTAASEKFNKSALIVLRGVEDGLTKSGRPFRVRYQSEPSREADLTITGRIVRLETRGGWKRYIGLSRKRYIELHGKVIDAGGGLAAEFYHILEKPYAEMSEAEFLLSAGEDIGKFLAQ